VSHELKRGGSSVGSGSGRSVAGSTPGKRTLLELGNDEQRLGAQLVVMTVLHT
jgi:hypothetical protein